MATASQQARDTCADGAGISHEVAETAGVLEVSERTVKREWHTARLWLLRALG